MIQSYISTLKKWSDFKGRATRSEYWIFFFLNVIFFLATTVVLVFVMNLKAGIKGSSYGDTGGSLLVFGIVVLVALLLAVPSIAVAVRRLHDANFSGWWWLINLIPQIGGIVFIVFMCLPSVNEGNRFGSLGDSPSNNQSSSDAQNIAHDEEVVAYIEEAPEEPPASSASPETKA